MRDSCVSLSEDRCVRQLLRLSCNVARFAAARVTSMGLPKLRNAVDCVAFAEVILPTLVLGEPGQLCVDNFSGLVFYIPVLSM
jgi:hypothetical protein